MDDTELTSRLATDLDGAFEALVRGHADRCHAIALRLLGRPADAEEVAQDVFLRAYRALASYPPARVRELRLRPWLAAITVNLARNRRRRLGDRTPPLSLTLIGGDGGETAYAAPAGAASSPEAASVARAERERWAALLAALPERYRVPLVLRHVDDLSYAEMSEALGRTEGTLKSQVHRGLVLLRAAWDAAEREEAIA
jgi:RNA polymerase sigma-70 factor (ECF subfamily)